MKYLAHLPCLLLDDGEDVPFAGGRLVHLTPEGWRALDSNYVSDEFRIERNRPLFFELEGELGTSSEFAGREAARAYYALALGKPDLSPAPAPRMSIVYRSDGPVTETHIGPLEYESLLWGLDREYGKAVLTDDDVSRASTALHVVDVLAATPRLEPLLEAIEWSARPEVDGAMSLCLGVSVLESVMLEDVIDGVRSAFGRRMGVVLSTGVHDLAAQSEFASNLYRLRSDVMHGAVRQSTLDLFGLADATHLSPIVGWSVLRAAAARFGALARAGVAVSELPAMLDRAAEAEAGYATYAGHVAEGGRPA